MLALNAWLSGARTHAMLNALMSMALRPFVSVAPTSTWAALLLCRQNMSPEVRARISAANRALGTTRAPVLSAQNIEQLTKNAALSSFVLSRFFYPTPTWPKLKCTQMRKMEGIYRNLARVASGCPCPDGVPAKSTAQMLSKVPQPPLQIAMAAARLLHLSRLLIVAPTALLILLDANRSWREMLRHDCIPVWLQATFVSETLPHPGGQMLLFWCDYATRSTRRWKHKVKAWARSHVAQAAWNDQPHPPTEGPSHADLELQVPCYDCGLSFASHRALIAHSSAAHAAVSFASRFILDVYCPCCQTLCHTRQRVHEHLVDGKRTCLQALAASVEPASDALVQQLLDEDKRTRRASKHLSPEWQPKHLPAIRMHGPVQSWATAQADGECLMLHALVSLHSRYPGQGVS